MKASAIKNIVMELSKDEYAYASVVINMKSGASIAATTDKDENGRVLSLNEQDDYLLVECETGTKWLSVEDIEYIEI